MSSKQNSDAMNAKNGKVAGTKLSSVKQGYPTSIPGNIKPTGNSTSGTSQSHKRGPQG